MRRLLLVRRRTSSAPDLAGEVGAVPSAHGARLERRGELRVRAPRITAGLEGGELGVEPPPPRQGEG